MPIDDLTALGQKKCGKTRKKKDLTQQLADLSHVSIKRIAKIEKGKINATYLIFEGIDKLSSALSGRSDQSRCFSRR